MPSKIRKLRQSLKSFYGIIIFIALLPLILIAALLYLLYVPFDIIRYHKTPYYIDNKVKYRFFIRTRDTVQLYNHIAKNNLQWKYVKNDDTEYFVKDDVVFFTGLSDMPFNDDNEWYFDCGEEKDGKPRLTAEEVLSESMRFVNEEDKQKTAKILMFYSDITDAELFEKAKKCPYFYCCFSIEEFPYHFNEQAQRRQKNEESL